MGIQSLYEFIVPVDRSRFNPKAKLPYGLTTNHIFGIMQEFVEFINFINSQLKGKNLGRIESMLMPANFSSMVGEFMISSLPKYCLGVVKNRYHNGHPDLLPAGRFQNDTIQYSHEGIEVKASRYMRGWQGHNPEHIWLLVFVFDSSRPIDIYKKGVLKPFKFLKVIGSKLTKTDWKFSGRSKTSRRTITASVTSSGFRKMESNWIYRAM